MPPFVPHKRRISSSPSEQRPRKKPSLFETVDQFRSPRSLADNQKFLHQLNGTADESSLSEIDSEDFEDALHPSPPKLRNNKQGDDDEDEDEEVAWEDAIDHEPSASVGVSGDIEITLDKASRVGFLPNRSDKKKGPSKIERQIRLSTHCMHVQFLLFHNLIRSGWAADSDVQKILISQLPPNVRKEVERWKSHSGLEPELKVDKSPKNPTGPKVRKGAQNKRKERSQRDWGNSAERQERGAPDMSRGDPLIRLLKILAGYWKKRFTISAPGLRKQGYKPIAVLEEEVSSYKNGPRSVENHGEHIGSLADFRRAAKSCEGSRDLGIQLFTCLLRGLGLEARLVASLQPLGFGWSKNEEASPKKGKAPNDLNQAVEDESMSKNESSESDGCDPVKKAPKKGKSKNSQTPNSLRSRAGASKDAPIDVVELSDDDALLSVDKSDDDESLIDITPTTKPKKPYINYDKDLPVPTYWTEVISPLTNKVYPVSTMSSISSVCISPDQFSEFEPKGSKADKAKQVLAYVIAYSPDGTAKDVTTRYLKRQMWPGRTKGQRIPIEKIPVYNRKGKIVRHEEYDWFKTVMSGYKRTDAMRTLVDELEDQTDLKPNKPEKKEVDTNKETLQGYKTSAEFVLERHLRREEALKPGSKPIKTFTVGKGEMAKEEPVYKREDVEVCRTGESWHKEGRAVKPGEHPMKLVPVRAVTLNRKREVEEAERDAGEKPKQGLYSRKQTEWIIPPPIENGVIPKNAYGNMDCFVPTMVPKGAAHVPYRGTVRVCKRLNVDFAEAVTGFEFGNKIAVPIITGVIVAKENEAKVVEEWIKDEEERRIKEDGKRKTLALATWRKWLMGLRVIQRFREEYIETADGHVREERNPFTNKRKRIEDQGLPAESLGENESLREESADSNGESKKDDELEIEGGGFLLPDDEEKKSIQETTLDIEDEEPKINTASEILGPLTMNNNARDIEAPNAGHDSSASSQSSLKPQPRPIKEAKGNAKSDKSRPTKRASKAKRHITPPSSAHGHKTAKVVDLSSQQNTPSGKGKVSATPQRRSARQSKKIITSPYFDHDSNDSDSAGYEDTDISDSDEVGKKPTSKQRRGRPAKTTREKSSSGRGRKKA